MNWVVSVLLFDGWVDCVVCCFLCCIGMVCVVFVIMCVFYGDMEWGVCF